LELGSLVRDQLLSVIDHEEDITLNHADLIQDRDECLDWLLHRQVDITQATKLGRVLPHELHVKISDEALADGEVACVEVDGASREQVSF